VFDSVAWPFLMEPLEHLGFSNAWINWIAELLRTVNTKVMLNGAPGMRIRHGHGLRQGDPLSPMLFILVMEVANALFCKANEWSLFHRLGARQITHRVSLYADDMIVFLTSAAPDLELTRNILDVFEGASRLACSMNKCQLALIHCEVSHLELATQFHSCTVMGFPLCYLGIPLSVTSLPKNAWQCLIDSVADKLPPWKGTLMHKSGRLTLIKSTLTAIPIHTTISLELPAWVRKTLAKIMRRFLWTGTESVQGGKCAVAWNLVQRSTSLSGLGIPDLRLMGMSLRLRWLWL
jgi:hypothetical protein